MVKSIYDQMLSSEFNEQARIIVSRDRDARKYGKKIDMANEIKRALERAYRRGMEVQLKGEPIIIPTKRRKAMHWILIPPSSRKTFNSICLTVFGLYKYKREKISEYYITMINHENKLKWALCEIINGQPKFDDYDMWGEKSINPLIKCGLLECVNKDENWLQISKKGEETWLEANEQKTINDFLD